METFRYTHRFLPTYLFPLLYIASTNCAVEELGEPLCLTDGATRVRLDPRISAGNDWLAHPFPSDHRQLEQGLHLLDFPNPGNSNFVDDYVIEAESLLDGFGLNSAVFLSFDAAIDPSSIPSEPTSFLDPSSPIQLVDVDPASSERGRRFPLRVGYGDAGDGFRPDHWLAAAPIWGFSLKEATKYALVITGDLRDIKGAPIAPDQLSGLALCEDMRCQPPYSTQTIRKASDRLEPLRSLFREEGLDLCNIAAATVFTTQRVTRDLLGMRDELRSLPPRRVNEWIVFENGSPFFERMVEWMPGERAEYYVLEGRFEAPVFLHGNVPYSTANEGGKIVLENGKPVIATMENLRFVLTVPKDPPGDSGCYPIVQYSHGTGGDAYSVASRTGGRLAGRGLAGIGIDQPLHGIRNEGKSYNVSLLSFNIGNVHSMRNLFRQSALDTFALTKLLVDGFSLPAKYSPIGEDICFETDSSLFFGHSQGGITGSMAAAFETDIHAWMFSGSGGGVGITILERKDPVDLQAVLAILGHVEDAQTIDEFHPLLMLVQMLTEVTDPINYSPYWLSTETPRHFLLTSGSNDAATPYRTALAKSAAAGMPLVEPTLVESISHQIAGIDTAQSPVSGNIAASTAAHIHWPDGDHFVVFTLSEAINASMRFLQTAASGIPLIERDPESPAR